MKDKKGKIIDAATDVGSSAVGAAAGAGIGVLVAGPVGAIGGSIVGTAIEKVIQAIGTEIKERCLSNSESRKIGTVYDQAKEKINDALRSGKMLREDDFFDETIDGRSSSEEILEGTLFAAQRESEERKLSYLANLYANINFDETISRAMANQLIKIAEDLTYRQLVILRIIGAYQKGDIAGVPPRRNVQFGSISGYNNISIASEIFDLYRKNLIFSQSAILDPAGITPSSLTVGGIGALIYNLMDLSTMQFGDDTREIVTFLVDVPSYADIGKIDASTLPIRDQVEKILEEGEISAQEIDRLFESS